MELLVLPRKLGIQPGDFAPRFIPLPLEKMAFPLAPLQFSPQTPPNHPQGHLALATNFLP
jgi:hypothetical protein